MAGAPVSATPADTPGRTGATPAGAAEPALLGPVPRPAAETLLIVVAAVAFQAVAWAILIWLLRADGPWYYFFDVSDIVVYLDYAQKVSQGLRVYQDFSFEYPPLALPLFTLPPHGDPAAYPNWFAAEMILLCSAAAALTGATAAALWRGLKRPLAAAGAYAVAVLAAGAITANRYDVAVALTLAACLLFLARRHTTAAGAALGVGVALKLTPGLLLPLVLIVAETRRRVLYALAGFLVFAIVPFLPFLGRFDGLTNVITYHAQRPLQIESVPGTPYLIAGALGKWGIGTGNSFGSQSLAGPAASSSPGSRSGSACCSSPGSTCSSGAAGRCCGRRPSSSPSPRWPACSPSPSATRCSRRSSSAGRSRSWRAGRGPQRVQRVAGDPDAAAIALTQVEFPGLYWQMVDLEPGPVAVVVVRNAVLVAAAVTAALAVWRLPAAAGATRSRRRQPGATRPPDPVIAPAGPWPPERRLRLADRPPARPDRTPAGQRDLQRARRTEARRRFRGR